jgi:PAS domain-containing protein
MDISKEYVRPSYVGYVLSVALIAAIWGWRQGFFTLGLTLIASNLILTVPRLKLHWMQAQDSADLIALILVGGVLVIALDQVRSSGAKTSRLLETVLAQQAQRQYVLDSLPVSVILCGMDGRILSMNPAAIALHGYNSGNVERAVRPDRIFRQRVAAYRCREKPPHSGTTQRGVRQYDGSRTTPRHGPILGRKLCGNQR